MYEKVKESPSDIASLEKFTKIGTAVSLWQVNKVRRKAIIAIVPSR